GLAGELEQLLGDLQVLLQRHCGTVPHVRLEGGQPTAADLLGLQRQQRAHPAVQVLLGAVVGVQRNGDRVVLGDLGGVGGQRERPIYAVLDGGAGGVLGTTDGHLDDAVALGLGEPAQRGREGLGRGDVDGRVGERTLLRPVDHLGVHLGGSNAHGSSPASGCVLSSQSPTKCPGPLRCATVCSTVRYLRARTTCCRWRNVLQTIVCREGRSQCCGRACWRIQACIAIAAAAPALMDRVDPYWLMCTSCSAPARASAVRPSDSVPNSSTQDSGSSCASI